MCQHFGSFPLSRVRVFTFRRQVALPQSPIAQPDSNARQCSERYRELALCIKTNGYIGHAHTTDIHSLEQYIQLENYLAGMLKSVSPVSLDPFSPISVSTLVT